MAGKFVQEKLKLKIMANPNSVLKLNVGGKEFMTTQSTLLSDQNSMLAKMFSPDSNGRIPATQDDRGLFSLTAAQYILE